MPGNYVSQREGEPLWKATHDNIAPVAAYLRVRECPLVLRMNFWLNEYTQGSSKSRLGGGAEIAREGQSPDQTKADFVMEGITQLSQSESNAQINESAFIQV